LACPGEWALLWLALRVAAWPLGLGWVAAGAGVGPGPALLWLESCAAAAAAGATLPDWLVEGQAPAPAASQVWLGRGNRRPLLLLPLGALLGAALPLDQLWYQCLLCSAWLCSLACDWLLELPAPVLRTALLFEWGAALPALPLELPPALLLVVRRSLLPIPATRPSH